MTKPVYLSAAVRSGARDRTTGMTIGCILDHVALTTAPLLKRRRSPINRRRRWQQIIITGKYRDLKIDHVQLTEIVRNWKQRVLIFDTHESAGHVSAVVGVVRDIRISNSELLGRVRWVK